MNRLTRRQVLQAGATAVALSSDLTCRLPVFADDNADTQNLAEKDPTRFLTLLGNWYGKAGVLGLR